MMSKIRHETKENRITKPVVLLGMMGSGKSTIGKKLAKEIGCSFVDSDHFIEKEIGMTIKKIFSKFGEDYFRKKEKQCLNILLKKPPSVIAIGGGTFIQNEIRNKIKKTSISVWLKVNHKVLVRRCRNSRNRPLLANKDITDEIKKLINDRYPIYKEANITFENNGNFNWYIVNKIKKEIEKIQNNK